MPDQIEADHGLDTVERDGGVIDEPLRAHLGGQEVRRFLGVEESNDHGAIQLRVDEPPGDLEGDGDRGGVVVGPRIVPSGCVVMGSEQDE